MSSPAAAAFMELLRPVFGAAKAHSLADGILRIQRTHPAATAALAYCIGALLLIVTASRRPAEALFDLRLALNLRAGRRPEAAEAAAAAGLSADGGGGLRCFHCGAEVAASESAGAAHAAASPDCSVGRLDVVLGADGGGTEAARLVSANSERSRRALQRLSRELDSLGRIIARAESFGFSRGSLVFAATRHFMLNGGQLPDRPGGFIECLQDCETQFGASARIVGIFSVNSLLRLLTPEQVAPAAATGTPAAATAASAAAPATPLRLAADAPTAGAAPAAGSGLGDIGSPVSDRCVLCAQRCRDRVLLPCAHFCACAACLADRSGCPVCGSRILATVRAFIT